MCRGEQGALPGADFDLGTASAPSTRRSVVVQGRVMRPIALVLVILAGCCLAPPHPAPEPTASVEVRVPRELLVEHEAMLPVNVFVRQRPGTLLHRGHYLATICDTENDVVVTWEGRVATGAAVDAWIASGYENDPNTPCGIAGPLYRTDRIADPPDGRPSASASISPGARVSLVLASP